MKKSLLVLLVITIVLTSNTSMVLSAKEDDSTSTVSAAWIRPMDALGILKAQVNSFPTNAFKDAKTADAKKNDILHSIDDSIDKVENGNLKCALNIVDEKIRNLSKESIIESEQPKLSENINLAAAAISNASKTIISTTSGKVSGVDASFNSWAYGGIPFAKPPVGELRWKAPQDPTPWNKIRYPVYEYSPCVQPAVDKTWIPANKITGSEDCLYLNVYRPKTYTKKLPVYFWIHGGGNFQGGSAEYVWASALSDKANMVVVVIQYRLGPFGFFNHPSLNPTGTIEEKSGNFAYLDMVKALKWVKRNISSFGGDPNNVTIAGESAGGFNVLNLMGSPIAKGLFHKAVSESAGGRNIPVSTGIERSNASIDKLLVADGTCPDLDAASKHRSSMSNAQISAYLKGKTAEELERTVMTSDGTILDNSPFIDGTVIRGSLSSVFESGKYNHVPVIMGTNKDEVKPWLPYMLGDIQTSSGHTWSDVYKAIGMASPSITLDELMPSQSDRDLYETCAKYPSLYWKASMVDSLARSLKKHQSNVYTYYFKWGSEGSGISPYNFLIGAGHAFDLSFFFYGGAADTWGDIWGNASFNDTNREGRAALEKAIISYVASFAASGNPNNPDNALPVWKQWSNKPNSPKSIILDSDFTQTKISMMNEEFTKEAVMSQFNALPDNIKKMIFRVQERAQFLGYDEINH